MVSSDDCWIVLIEVVILEKKIKVYTFRMQSQPNNCIILHVVSSDLSDLADIVFIQNYGHVLNLILSGATFR